MAESAANGPERKQQATAEAGSSPVRDPFLLALVVVLLAVYVLGQWMTFTAINARLDALEQRIVDSTSRVDTKVAAVEETVVQAARAARAAPAAPTAAASASAQPLPQPATPKPPPAKPAAATRPPAKPAGTPPQPAAAQ